VGLSDDQRALLRLLAQREEGYEDIAALMGLGVDEVRARVKQALAALDEGQAGAAAGPVAAGDPPSSAVAEASSGAVPPAAPPAGEAAASPGSPAPRAAETPAPRTAESAEPRTAEPAEPRLSRGAAATRQRAARSPRMGLPRERRRLLEVAGGALVLLLIVLFASGAVDIGGGGDSDSDSGAKSAASGEGAAGAESGELTQAVLRPVGGGDARGRAVFGRIDDEVVLQVEARNLAPTSGDQAYSVWLYRSPKLVLRVGAAKVGADGRLAAQFPIPAELLGFVANGAFRQIAVSLLSEPEYEAALARAKKRKQLPGYLGEDTLRGRITGPAIG
jgi:hypothetical protein